MTFHENLKMVSFFLVLSSITFAIRTMLKFQMNSYKKTNKKRAEYECGYEPFDFSSRQPFNIHFYFVGIVFVLFDVEVAIIFPWAYSFWNLSDYAFFLGMFISFFIVIGICYEWVTKAIVWEDFSVSKVKKNGWIWDTLMSIKKFIVECPEQEFFMHCTAFVCAFIRGMIEFDKALGPWPVEKKTKDFNFCDFFYNIDYYNFFEDLLYFLYTDMNAFCSQESFDIKGTIPALPLLDLYYEAWIFALDHEFHKPFFQVAVWYENHYVPFWEPSVMFFITHFAFRAMSHSNYNFTLETDASEIGFESCYVSYLAFLLKSFYTINDSYFYPPEKTISMFGVLDTNLFLQQQISNATPFFEEKFYVIFCNFYKYSLIEFNSLFSCETFDDKFLINYDKTFDKKINILFAIKALVFYFIFVYYSSKIFCSKKI